MIGTRVQSGLINHRCINRSLKTDSLCKNSLCEKFILLYNMSEDVDIKTFLLFDIKTINDIKYRNKASENFVKA